jgi:hypothetical protein
MTCGRLPKSSCRPGSSPAAPDRPSGRAHTFGITRFTISSPTRHGSRTKIRSGARAHPPTILAHAHSPPTRTCAQPGGQIRSVAFASIEVCPLAGRPQWLGGETDDRDWTGRTQAVGDRGCRQRGRAAARRKGDRDCGASSVAAAKPNGMSDCKHCRPLFQTRKSHKLASGEFVGWRTAS